MVAFVLSGGASHGAVQVGMLRALAAAGIEPAALYGTSVGAVNAAAIAHLQPAERLDALTAAWRDFARKPPVRPSLARNVTAAIRRRPSIADPSPLRKHLEVTFGETRIEEAATPHFVAATNLLDGHERVFDRGRLVEVLMASCAVPGLFPPVEIDGTPYVDGLLYGAPTRAAVADGHTTLYVLATNSKLVAGEVPRTWWGIARRAATMVMWNQAAAPSGDRECDVTVRAVPAPPSMAAVGHWDFAHTERLLADSYEVASRWLSTLVDEELVP